MKTMSLLWIKILLFLLSFLCLCPSQPSTPLLRFSTFLDHSNMVYMRWDHDEVETMTFELQVRTAGWVAFGFSPHGELPGSDIVIGGVFPNGSIYFSDWHAVDEENLEEDKSQDYQLLSLKEDETFTIMRFKRYFQTCDPNDLAITGDTARLISAFGTDNTIQFSKGQRFIKSLFLMRVINPAELNEPKIFFTYDLMLTDFPIPVEETTYACTFIPLPIVKQKHHIYKFEPITTTHQNTLMAHHILVYGCDNGTVLPTGISDCYGADPDFALCSQVIIGWAVGGGIYQFPNEAAISIGTPMDPQYIRLEIHYSNFDLIPGLIDNSGIRLYYTPELRPYDMGVLQTGVFTFPVHFIPPGADSYKSYGLCKTSQFDEMNGTPVPDLKVLSFLLHTHLAGRGVKAVQYRNGEQVRIICKDNKYDFSLQEARDLKEAITIKMDYHTEVRHITLKPINSTPTFFEVKGDEILVECNFQTLDRTEITFGGLSTLNEMCLVFLFYYPRNNISSCMGYPDIQQIAHALSQEVSDAMEGMMAVNYVEWNNETIKAAEKAAKEADQIVIIKTIHRITDMENTYPVYAEVKAKSLDTNNLDSCSTGDQRRCTRGRVLALTAVTGLLLVIGVTLIFVCLTTTQDPAELQMSSTTARNTSHKSGCPPGWKQHEKNCYFFSQTENKDWNSSREECFKNDSDLVIINNREEWEFLNTTSRAEQATVYYFLGLTYSETERRWEWYNNTELNTNIFNVTTAPDTSDYLCAVFGHGKVANAHCSGSSTTKYVCQKAVA